MLSARLVAFFLDVVVRFDFAWFSLDLPLDFMTSFVWFVHCLLPSRFIVTNWRTMCHSLQLTQPSDTHHNVGLPVGATSACYARLRANGDEEYVLKLYFLQNFVVKRV